MVGLLVRCMVGLVVLTFDLLLVVLMIVSGLAAGLSGFLLRCFVVFSLFSLYFVFKSLWIFWFSL